MLEFVLQLGAAGFWFVGWWWAADPAHCQGRNILDDVNTDVLWLVALSKQSKF